MHLTERQLTDNSNVEASFLTGRLPSRPWQNYEELLVVRFLSKSPVDWRDILFMRATVAAGIRVWQPNAVVLDLRELPYAGGDTMASVLHECEFPQLPSNVARAVVVSDENRMAMVSLLENEMRTSSRSILFDSIEHAVIAVDDAMSK
jgi:hypothetical protein